MTSKEEVARMTEAIGTMLAGFPNSQSANEVTVMAYLKAVEDRHPKSVMMACDSLLKGEVSNFDSSGHSPSIRRRVSHIRISSAAAVFTRTRMRSCSAR